jgi:hypothetical protein
MIRSPHGWPREVPEPDVGAVFEVPCQVLIAELLGAGQDVVVARLCG